MWGVDLLPLFVFAAVVFLGWLASHSMAGSVARTPETEAALAAAAEAVAQSLQPFGLGALQVVPVWAHGCPCVRVSIAAEVAKAKPEAASAARKAAARALEDAVRASPAFAHVAGKYRGEQGLHWY